MTNKKAGRPSKLTIEQRIAIMELARSMKYVDIARKLGLNPNIVDYAIFNSIKNTKNPLIAQSLSPGRKAALKIEVDVALKEFDERGE
jgi:hypothetical protein